MIYFIPAATAAMLAYMFWRAFFRMRRDRVMSEREQTRGKFAFRPKERLRLLLNRSFNISPDKPEWEDPLVSTLAKIPAQDGSKGPEQVRRSESAE